MYIPFTYKAEVTRVVDGDTIDVELDLGFSILMRARVRLLGIDTPESRTRDLEEKKRGLAAKDRVKCLLEECDHIELKSHGVGKYGRCLGEISLPIDGELCSLNQLLISEGHAVAYFGGKR